MMATTSSGAEGSDSILEDMMLLLECLKFQKDCISSQKQALTTMATMCTSSATARDLFRSGGCLEYVVHLVKMTKSSEIMQAGLCALGCATERNVSSQMRLSEEGMFTLLKDILNSKETTLLLKSTAVVMITSVLNSNSQGQKVAFQTKLLSKLIDLFKTFIPFNNGTGNEKHVELWSNVAQALSAACDNPQNELNQNNCCAVFPVSVSLIQYAVGNTDHLTSPALLRPAITVLTSGVANNERAQDRLHMVGGLRALTLLLNTLIQTDQTLQSTLTKDHLSLALHIIRALCAASSNNANNIKYLASFQVVHLFLHLLTHEDLDSFGQLSIIMCLETLTENNEVHQQHLLEKEGDRILISMMAESREEMLNKTIPVIIQTCLKTKKLTSDATAITSTTQTHIQKLYSILHKMEELTERGDDNEEIPDSPSANFRLSPQPQTTDVDVLDDALKDLGTKKLPLQVKIKEWLDKGEHEMIDSTTEMKTYCTHLKNMLNTLIQRQQVSNTIDDNTSIPGPPSQPVHTTMLNEPTHCREDLNINDSVFTAPSIAIQSRLDDLEKQLAQEREERLILEQKLNEKQSVHIPEETVRKVITVDSKQKDDYQFKKPIRPNVRQTSKPSPAITTSVPNPSNRQCTPRPQHSRKLSVPPTPKRPNQRPNKIALFQQTSKQQPRTKHLPDVPVCSAINTPMSIASGLTNIPMSHSTPKQLQATTSANASIDELFPTRTSHHDCCLGCQSTCQVLTSRTFLPRLSLDKHTCRYHKKIAESILTKRVLILDVSHLNKSSQGKILNTPQPATEVHSVVELQPTALSQKEAVEKKCSNVDNCPHLISPPASADRPSVSPQLQQVHSIHNQQDNYPRMKDYKSDSNSKRTHNTITHHVSSTKRLKPPLVNPNVYKPLQDIINQQKIPKRSKPSPCVYDYNDETLTTAKKIKMRQVNLPYSKDEVKYLLKGVNQLGPRWKHILMAYPFKTGRTALSLKDKYRLLTKHK